jgi:hypothetical protein
MIEDARDSGEASPGLDVRYASFFALTAVIGLPTWYRRRGPDPAEYIADVYADMIVAMVSHADGGPPARIAGKATGSKTAGGKQRQTRSPG